MAVVTIGPSCGCKSLHGRAGMESDPNWRCFTRASVAHQRRESHPATRPTEPASRYTITISLIFF